MTLIRIEKLQSLAASQGLAAIAIVPGPNMIYFTGLQFHLSERPTVALFPAGSGQTPAIILPALEADKPDNAPFPMQKFITPTSAARQTPFGRRAPPSN